MGARMTIKKGTTFLQFPSVTAKGVEPSTAGAEIKRDTKYKALDLAHSLHKS